MNASSLPPKLPVEALTPPAASRGFELTPDNPWPGLQTFVESGRAFFHGRRDETEELLRLIRRERLVVFYGQSGLGKSSLLRAGVFPLLRPLRLLPVALRLDYSENALLPVEQVKQELLKTFVEHRIQVRPQAEGESLWAYFHAENIHFLDEAGQSVMPVLVFDQFEERFSLGRANAAVDARAEAFLTELSQLVENRPPPELRARLDADPDAALAYDFHKPGCKVVLTLREDFLPELEGLTDRFPSLPSSRLRLLPMTSAQARQVILGSGSHLVTEPVADAIVDFVVAGHSRRAVKEVEPALLSLVLQELNARRKQRGDAQISVELLSGSREKILEDFYEQATRDLPSQARLFLEDGLLTSTGYRDSLALENARAEFGLDDPTLAILISRHLVRREERLGSTRLELLHDLLTGVIAQSRRRRLDRDRIKHELEQEWRAKNETVVRIASRLNAMAEDWNKNRPQRTSLLISGPPLCEALELHSLYPELLTANGRDFVVESQNKWRRGRWIWFSVTSFILVLAGCGIVYDLQHKLPLQENFESIAVLLPPFLLAWIDRLPKRVARKHFRRSALLWSLYSWFAVLLSSYLWLDPTVWSASIGGALALGCVLLVPLFKWRTYIQVHRQALQPIAPLSPTPAIALLITAAIVPVVIIASRVSPTLFRTNARGQTTFTTNSVGWIVRTVIDRSNAGGKVEEVSYFAPAYRNEGYHKTVVRYDVHGNSVEGACFDADGKPTHDEKFGAHKWRAAHDVRGNVTNWIAFGSDDKRANCYYGYCETRSKYDKRSRQTEWACFDKDGKPTLDPCTSTHLVRKEFDERGNATNVCYFGVDEKPGLCREGYHRQVNKYDAEGRQTDCAYFGESGEPVPGKDGYHRRVVTHDSAGRIVSEQRLDTKGNPIVRAENVRQVVSIGQVFPDTQAAVLGLQKGDIVWGYEDWKFVNYAEAGDLKRAGEDLTKRIFAVGEKKRRLVIVRDGQLKTFEVAPGRLGVRFVDSEQSVPPVLLQGLTRPTNTR